MHTRGKKTDRCETMGNHLNRRRADGFAFRVSHSQNYAGRVYHDFQEPSTQSTEGRCGDAVQSSDSFSEDGETGYLDDALKTDKSSPLHRASQRRSSPMDYRLLAGMRPTKAFGVRFSENRRRKSSGHLLGEDIEVKRWRCEDESEPDSSPVQLDSDCYKNLCSLEPEVRRSNVCHPAVEQTNVDMQEEFAGVTYGAFVSRCSKSERTVLSEWSAQSCKCNSVHDHTDIKERAELNVTGQHTADDKHTGAICLAEHFSDKFENNVYPEVREVGVTQPHDNCSADDSRELPPTSVSTALKQPSKKVPVVGVDVGCLTASSDGSNVFESSTSEFRDSVMSEDALLQSTSGCSDDVVLIHQADVHLVPGTQLMCALPTSCSQVKAVAELRTSEQPNSFELSSINSNLLCEQPCESKCAETCTENFETENFLNNSCLHCHPHTNSNSSVMMSEHLKTASTSCTCDQLKTKADQSPPSTLPTSLGAQMDMDISFNNLTAVHNSVSVSCIAKTSDTSCLDAVECPVSSVACNLSETKTTLSQSFSSELVGGCCSTSTASQPYIKLDPLVEEQDEAPVKPDIDVVDGVTFHSFPSKHSLQSYVIEHASVRLTAATGENCIGQGSVADHWSHNVLYKARLKPRRIWLSGLRNRHADKMNANRLLHKQLELGLIKPLTAAVGQQLGLPVNDFSEDSCRTKNTFGSTNGFVQQKTRRIQLPSRKPLHSTAAMKHRTIHPRLTDKRKGGRLKTSENRLEMTSLDESMIETALEMLQVPRLVSHKDCSQPGCQFGCICELFVGHTFSHLVGADVRIVAVVPEIHCAFSLPTSLSNRPSDQPNGHAHRDVKNSPSVSEDVSPDNSTSHATKWHGNVTKKHMRRTVRNLLNEARSTGSAANASPSRTKTARVSSKSVARCRSKTSVQSQSSDSSRSVLLCESEPETLLRKTVRQLLLQKSRKSQESAKYVPSAANKEPLVLDFSAGSVISEKVTRPVSSVLLNNLVSSPHVSWNNPRCESVKAPVDILKTGTLENGLKVQHVASGKTFILRPVAKSTGSTSRSSVRHGLPFYSIRPVCHGSPLSASTPIPKKLLLPDFGCTVSPGKNASLVPFMQSAGNAGHSSAVSLTGSAESQSVSVLSNAVQSTHTVRTQMVLLQHNEKRHSPGVNAGHSRTCLLQITSNCAWETSRSKILSQLAGLTSDSTAYPATCVLVIDGFRVEIQPRPDRPTPIPCHIQKTLKVSEMVPVRVRISTESRSSSSFVGCSSVGPEVCVQLAGQNEAAARSPNMSMRCAKQSDGTFELSSSSLDGHSSPVTLNDSDDCIWLHSSPPDEQKRRDLSYEEDAVRSVQLQNTSHSRTTTTCLNEGAMDLGQTGLRSCVAPERESVVDCTTTSEFGQQLNCMLRGADSSFPIDLTL